MLWESTIRAETSLARWRLTQIAVTEEGELQVDDVEPRGAEYPIERLLHRRHRDPQPLEAPGRHQGAELHHALRTAVPAIRIGNQFDGAAVGLHRTTAFLDVELVVDQHHGRKIVASGQLGHQAVHPGLSAKPRRTGRNLGNAENVEPL